MTLIETMDHFLLIDENTNNIEYRYSIDSEISTDRRDEKLYKKKKRISEDNGIPFSELFWESTPTPV